MVANIQLGVGQAAIVLAQYIGAEIFATVSTEAKKSLLMEKFNIKEDHIFNSRDTQFAQGIKRMTKGQGVDVVLNSLAGEALQQSWKCIRSFGRFIEMGQKDIGKLTPSPPNPDSELTLSVGNTGLEMAPFIRNVSFHSINMLAVLEDNISLASKIFAEVVDLLKKGIVQPIRPLVSMSFSKIEEAFRLMQTGQHTGKIVLAPADNELVPVRTLLINQNTIGPATKKNQSVSPQRLLPTVSKPMLPTFSAVALAAWEDP